MNLIPKTIVHILMFLIFIGGLSIHTNAEQNTSCEAFLGKEKYRCQITQHCDINYKPEHIAYTSIDYINDDPNPFLRGKKIYRKNQNSIYSCSLIKIQENSLNYIKKNLLKQDKTGFISGRIQNKITLSLTKLKAISNNKQCKNTNKTSIYAKKDLLIESTYQICKYSFYLEYMKEYYTDINNTLRQNVKNNKKSSYQISTIIELHNNIQTQIEQEKKHTFKIFHLAFQSYIDYESNLPVHLLLSIIKEDFIAYRQKLYQTINPINQVGYKIMNAMSIH